MQEQIQLLISDIKETTPAHLQSMIPSVPDQLQANQQQLLQQQQLPQMSQQQMLNDLQQNKQMLQQQTLQQPQSMNLQQFVSEQQQQLTQQLTQDPHQQMLQQYQMEIQKLMKQVVPETTQPLLSTGQTVVKQTAMAAENQRGFIKGATESTTSTIHDEAFDLTDEDDEKVDGLVDPQLALVDQLLSLLDNSELHSLAAELQKNGYLEDVILRGVEKAEPAKPQTAPVLQEVNKQVTKIEGEAEKRAKAERSSKLSGDETSLLIQYLPEEFDQKSCMDWLDSHGYRDLYDVLMWFPAKKTAKMKQSRAIMNFRSPESAQRLKAQFQSTCPFDGPGKEKMRPLHIVPANAQGFKENFKRYWHLTKQSVASSAVIPFFARDMVATASTEEVAEAEQIQSKSTAAVDEASWGTATTIIIRNLPLELESQSAAMAWLAGTGHGTGYDFLLFVPRKMSPPKKKDGGTSSTNLAYIFVNFLSPQQAEACAHALQNRPSNDGMPALSIVPSKLQGFQQCCNHFKDLSSTGRLVPWIRSQEASKDWTVNEGTWASYQ